MPPVTRIGTQGWNYKAWLSTFFPDGTRLADFLPVYSRAFNTVEVDSTFYAIPPSTTIRGWVSRTPDDFIFSLKFPEAVTHEGRLRDPAGLTEQFFDRVRELGSKLGPVLVQLGPDFGPQELPALVDFLPRLPRDLKIAIEFRQRAWVNEGVLALLRDHNIALALVDGPWMPRRWALKLADKPTADFAYIRWMGPNRNLVDHSRIQVDRLPELSLWRDTMLGSMGGVNAVYAYMSNYYAGHAPQSARDIQHLLGHTPVDPDTIGEQMRLL